MAEPVFMSALSGTAMAPGLSISVREISDRGMIDLRGDPKDAAFRQVVERVLGVALPATPRTSSPSPQGGGEQSSSSSSPSPGLSATLSLRGGEGLG
ncbi:MAG: hypothetical protein AB7S41_19985, partial [Parvibaculaceae bacterium]